MSFTARALYDFESVGDGELGVRVGDTVTVLDTTTGQGWWTARAGEVVRQEMVHKMSLSLVVSSKATSFILQYFGDSQHPSPIAQ